MRGRKPAPAMPIDVRDKLAGHVARHFGVDVAAITRGGRNAAWPVLSRQVCLYLAHVEMGFSLSAIAAAFGRDRSGIAHSIEQVEELRDTPIFEVVMQQLSQSMRTTGAVRS